MLQRWLRIGVIGIHGSDEHRIEHSGHSTRERLKRRFAEIAPVGE
jgi:hypothetical protein